MLTCAALTPRVRLDADRRGLTLLFHTNLTLCGEIQLRTGLPTA